MTRLRHTNLVNALFYLPRPAVVLVPLLLKGLTLIVTLGVTAWLRSTWVDLCVLAAVIGYTLRDGVLCGMPWTGKCCASGRGSGFGKPPPFRRSGSRWWRRCGLFCCGPSGCVSLRRTPLRAAGGGRISGSISQRRIPGRCSTPIPMGTSTCPNSSSTVPAMPVCCCSRSLLPIRSWG